MKLFYTDHFDLPLPEGHRFPMDKYRLLREQALASNDRVNGEKYQLLVPISASDDQLLLAHSAEYLARICSGNLEPLDIKRIGFPWTPELVIRSRYSTGATICAALSALEQGVSANLAGGTHHAFAATAAGYCLFNDVVVAARQLQRDGAINQVLVVDCDVHQGNGTASIAADDASIFTLSLHGKRNYPFKKASSDIDVGLEDGTDDTDYLDQLKHSLDLALLTIPNPPEFVFYVAGADPFAGDRLGRLSLTKDGLRHRDLIVYEFAKSIACPSLSRWAEATLMKCKISSTSTLRRSKQPTKHGFSQQKASMNNNEIPWNKLPANVDQIGIVIVDHGSRRKESNELLLHVVDNYRHESPFSIIEPAHMELAEPSLGVAFDQCVNQGAKLVVVHPYFLLPGRHWNGDIPQLSAEAAQRHPGVDYLVTAPLGVHPLMATVMQARIAQCLSHAAGDIDACQLCEGTDKCEFRGTPSNG